MRNYVSLFLFLILSTNVLFANTYTVTAYLPEEDKEKYYRQRTRPRKSDKR